MPWVDLVPGGFAAEFDVPVDGGTHTVTLALPFTSLRSVRVLDRAKSVLFAVSPDACHRTLEALAGLGYSPSPPGAHLVRLLLADDLGCVPAALAPGPRGRVPTCFPPTPRPRLVRRALLPA
jgi:hypothetical protein